MSLFHGTSLVAGGITVALLTGCSGGTFAGPTIGGAIQSAAIRTETSSGHAALRSRLLPGMPTHGTGVAVHPFIDFAAMAKNRPTIAISAGSGNVVDLFTAAGTQVGQLTGFDGAAGMAGDAKGDLYVADTYNSRVQIYAAGFASPPVTLSDPGQYPYDVDSYANGTYVAVANIAVGNVTGSVSIFKGSRLLRTITSPNLGAAYFCAFDGKGNLYLDGEDQNGDGNVLLGEIPNATSGGRAFQLLTTTNQIDFAAGIQVTTVGQIAIEDANNRAIYTYNPPIGGSLGTPTQITPLGGTDGPLTFAFTKNMTHLFTADNYAPSVFEFAYPSGGTAVSTFSLSGFNPIGTAVIPTQHPPCC
jgi:hypothetical protein